MEEIKIRVGELERLVVLLLIQKERLEERKGIDPSKESIHKTLLAIKQLNKKLDTILDGKAPKTLEELKAEVCKNE